MTEIESKSEIEKLFSNKKIPLMFEYYGTQDLMTGYELSNLIDNADFFEASSGSVGRNESLIWQQGRDI
jgi:hypothetical protein